MLSRNFGSQAAFSCGMEEAKGDCMINRDGDFKIRPPIPEFLKKWEEGFDVVYGEREKREAPLPLQIAYKGFTKYSINSAIYQFPLMRETLV